MVDGRWWMAEVALPDALLYVQLGCKRNAESSNSPEELVVQVNGGIAPIARCVSLCCKCISRDIPACISARL